MDDEDERRKRAYRIWEKERRPEGQHLDHWQRAEDQHEMTERAASTSAPAEKAGKQRTKNRKSVASGEALRPIRE